MAVGKGWKRKVGLMVCCRWCYGRKGYRRWAMRSGCIPSLGKLAFFVRFWKGWEGGDLAQGAGARDRSGVMRDKHSGSLVARATRLWVPIVVDERLHILLTAAGTHSSVVLCGCHGMGLCMFDAAPQSTWLCPPGLARSADENLPPSPPRRSTSIPWPIRGKPVVHVSEALRGISSPPHSILSLIPLCDKRQQPILHRAGVQYANHEHAQTPQTPAKAGPEICSCTEGVGFSGSRGPA